MLYTVRYIVQYTYFKQLFLNWNIINQTNKTERGFLKTVTSLIM